MHQHERYGGWIDDIVMLTLGFAHWVGLLIIHLSSDLVLECESFHSPQATRGHRATFTHSAAPTSSPGLTGQVPGRCLLARPAKPGDDNMVDVKRDRTKL